jgi:cell division protein FtsI (penicillin-binding protein 3)
MSRNAPDNLTDAGASPISAHSIEARTDGTDAIEGGGSEPTDAPPPRLSGRQLLIGWVMLCGLVAGNGLVVAHTYKMLKTKGPEFTDGLEDAITNRIMIPAQRGGIYDRHGVPLAVSEVVHSCFFDPKIWVERRNKGREKQADELLEELAAALSTTVADLRAKFAGKETKRFVWLKRTISEAERQAVEAVRAKFHAGEIGLQMESRRSYPQGPVASHVIGFVNADGAQEGLEKSWDAWLSGKDGYFYAKFDSGGRPVEPLPADTRMPVNGRSLMLTVDVAIQQRAEAVLAEACRQYSAPSGSAVVMDCKTGEILALANYPTYDPNKPGEAVGEARKNRAITDPYEPGSTFKVFVAAAAMEQKVTRLGDMINCHGGAFTYMGRTLHDHHPLGVLPLEQVVAKSSNCGMAELGLRMGPQRLYDALLKFGFGRTTGLGLPGESRGLMYPPTRWSGTSILSISMGQECAVTVMQLVQGFGAIANGGTLIRPKVVRTVTDGGAEPELDLSKPAAVGRAMDPVVAGQMVDPVLSLVVKEGTGVKSQLKDYQVFGKTGTAQVAKVGGRGYESGLYVGSFIAAAPARDPRIVVMVGLNRVDKSKGGYYGGTVAAPAVRQIMEFALPYLKVPPDPPTATDASAAGGDPADD